ncbi:alternative NAD(P)H-ubiquinone oxidoreductase C1, chloroplastic/mitochondrial [Curcuma longa]|uniref:alternative NAD(P)H-ubiquinone oxidoreductase C1, chloroplastic/mitochondrial n=1 Tax=Curcuma longa TaxID=136217 RepID=UPI003D9F9F85
MVLVLVLGLQSPPPSATSMSSSAGWRFPVLVGGPSEVGHRPRVRLFKNDAGPSVPSKGLRDHLGRAAFRVSKRHAGALAIFAATHLGFFHSPLSGGNGVKFIAQASGGEAASTSYTWPEKQRPRICILGGGFGGLYTALRLESLVWEDDKRPQVVLVDQSDRFVFKPMLYELLSGEVDAWEVAPLFTDLLKSTSIQFIKDRVKLLHPCDHLNQSTPDHGSTLSGGTVHLESGVVIEYDWVVLALGAESKLDVVPGSAEYALPFSTLADALKVDERLKSLERKRFGKDCSPISVAIVGCGYSGVELAATISERLKDKGIVQAINVETTICPNAPPGNREAALRILQSRNVQLFLGYYVSCIKETSSSENLTKETTPTEVGSGGGSTGGEKFILELQPAQRGLGSQILEADLVLWTVGSKPLIPQLTSTDYYSGIPLNGKGQAETDETLRVRGHPKIFAIGDSSALRDSSGKILPATAQVAFQQADFTGWNLWAAINGRPLLPFRFQNLGEMMTLGMNDAAISPSFIDGLTLDGPLGHAARKIAYLFRMPTDEHRLKVGVSWLAKSAIDSIAMFQSSIARAITGS